MNLQLHEKKYTRRILMTFTTMIISLLAFMIGSDKAFAIAPAGYFNFLEASGNFVLGSDLEMTFYIDPDDASAFMLTDEELTFVGISGGGLNNFPLLRSIYDGYSEFRIQIWDGTEYDTIHTSSLNGEQGWFQTTGGLTLGAWAYGKTITPINTAIEPFFYAKELSSGGPVGSVPVLNGWEGVYITNVNSPVSLASLKSLISAYDDEDGDVSANIVVDTDNYTANLFVVGLHEVTFSVSDSNNNVSTLTLYVKVVDATAPVINGNSSFTSNMSAPLTVNDIKGTFTVSDNYDTLTASNIVVKTDNFTTNKLVKGTYSVIYEVQDTSGNKGQKSVSVTVVDDIKPVITGTTTYTKGQDAILSLDTIKAGLTATDNVDGNVSATLKIVEDNFSSKGSTVGTWTVKFEANDTAGNKSLQYVVSITVTDTMPPVFFVDESIVSIDQSLTLTQQQILDILSETGQLNLSMAHTASFVIDEYAGTQEVGSYPVSVKIDYANGTTKVVNLTVNVVEQTFTSYPVSKWYQSWSGWTKSWFGAKILWDGVVDVWNWVVSKVQGLLSWLGIK